MKLKEIHLFLIGIVKCLEAKRDAEKQKGSANDVQEHTEGQLYEARYILNEVEDIIYENSD